MILQPDHIGIISIRLQLKRVIEKWAAFAQQLAIQRYGHAPDIRSGHKIQFFWFWFSQLTELFEQYEVASMSVLKFLWSLWTNQGQGKGLNKKGPV